MTKSRRRKRAQRILDALKEKAPLSTNRGDFDRTPGRKPTSKQRRHRGWRTPRIADTTMKFSEMIENALEPPIEYDDWLDFRDGMRDTREDKSRFIPVPANRWWWDFGEEEIREHNKKIKKQIAIRKARRESKRKGNDKKNKTL